MPQPKFGARELSDLCTGLVAEMLERSSDDVDVNSKFSRMGLDSAMSVQLIVAIEEEIGIELTPDVIGEHPTIARLSAYLATLCAARETEA
jgi:acyl carrier protein